MRDTKFKNSYELRQKPCFKDGSCQTCHCETGKGLPQGDLNIYPPLVDSDWTTGDKERTIKIVLHGMHGKIVRNGKTYGPPTTSPMIPYAGLYSDAEVAAALNFVLNTWGSKADEITVADVKPVRAATKVRKLFWKPEDLSKGEITA